MSIAVRCLVSLLAVCALTANACAEPAPEEEVTEASGAALSKSKQPKLGLFWSTDAGYVPAGRSVCPSSSLVAAPALRSEALMATVAELVYSPPKGDGYEAVIKEFDIGRSSGSHTPDPVNIRNFIPSFDTHVGREAAVQIVQRRKNGKVVGTSDRIPFVTSPPKFDLFSVQVSAKCGDRECYAINTRMYPELPEVGEDGYSCVDNQLGLFLRESDGTWVKAYFPKELFRTGGTESHLTSPIDLPDFHATSAALIYGDTLVSRWVDIER